MDKPYKTPIKAMRAKCIDCCCGSYKEIKECTVIDCDLYPYRMGRRPSQETLDTLEAFYEENPELA